MTRADGEGSRGTVPWANAAVAALATKDTAGYKKACAELLQRSGPGGPGGWEAALEAAWTCAVSPKAVDDWTGPLAAAERALAEYDESEVPPVARREYPHLLRVARAGVLVRAGRDGAALSALTEAARAQDGRLGLPGRYFLALIQHRQGDALAARGELERARQDLRGLVRHTDWPERLALSQLDAEVEALLRPPADRP